VVFVWLRFLTAPFRALSPTGLFTAISLLRSAAPRGQNWNFALKTWFERQNG
jgi:hypothetical protein